jgi:murein endopeptidase
MRFVGHGAPAHVALPSAIAASASLTGVVFNDFSNMNGGFFPDHSSHREGTDVDVFFGAAGAATFAPTRANAQKLIDILNSPAFQLLEESHAGAHLIACRPQGVPNGGPRR